MTHELILTSVAQGLTPKDHGFCPVASDSAISSRIVEHLSVLSCYRHLATESGNSPVVYSHFILPGRIEHVLSCMTVTGVDYKQQPNVLAHHIVLEGLELVPEGPAWLLALPGFHLSEWNAPPLRFLHGRLIPTLTTPESLTRRQLIARQSRWLDPHKMALSGFVNTESEHFLASFQNNEAQVTLAAPPTTPCPTWEALTGDAGWGGVLAETVVSGQPVVIVYNPKQNILPLFVEALALLPPYSSWQTTFCTYYTGQPDVFPCQWKGVITGSEEAQILIKDSNNWVLDISVPMQDAPPGKYVEYARFGQEHLLPLEAEEYSILANADTKSFDDVGKHETDKLDAPPATPPNKIMPIFVPPTIPHPKYISPFESFLHHSSRAQFSFLYCTMFALVLFLIILVVDQVGSFGVIQTMQNWLHPAHPTPPEKPKEKYKSALDEKAESLLDVSGPDEAIKQNSIRTIFEAEREKKKIPLLHFWESFVIPECLPHNFPNVENDQIDIPAKKTLGELSPLYPFGAALEIQFIPLFELPKKEVGTRFLTNSLPDLFWQVEAIDIETDLSTPIFHFQLTESGLEIDWQQEGLNSQHLHETIIFSLGFLKLSVAEIPETEKQIPLFIPQKIEPVKVSDLARLAESESNSVSPEYVVELPFASDLWQRIFAEMNPPNTLRLEVWAEPTGNWVQMNSPASSVCRVEIHTTQQVGKPTEGGETVFENLRIPFSAEASLERVFWKANEYAEQLRSETADATAKKNNLENTIEELQRKVFEGDASARTERDRHETEVRALILRLKEIENILEKLPEAYKEISRNETRRFHYSVFLEPETQLPGHGDKALLILTTGQ